ncbi:ATP-dependent Lon protease pim1, partial [Podochytrium sp. JEL0797]
TISEILHVLKEISLMNPLLRDQILTFSIQTGGNAFQDAGKLADFAAAVSSGEPLELQAVLESADVTVRLQKALYVLKKELANAKLQKEISSEVDKKITRKQQEYFLMEQLKGIKKELGMESDGKDKLVIKFKERAEALTMPAEIRKVFDEEIAKLMNLEPQASEFNVTRNYLDWLTTIPWGKYSTENFDIANARVVLDEDHYGLKDVKDRILEFIAVGKLRGTVEGKIICMVGPPGVGKTSVGKSIARALGREFFRFSVGGLTDVAEIKGHRRTYVGAMPGKVIQALKKVQTENPLIMIDEIDKVGRGHQGDPSSALLELLDPEQNSSFLDHYMDVPLDLSKVLFVCTANSLDTIPGPLLDRMEVITVSGYVAEEKKAIAMRYLGPAALVASGLREEQVEVTEGAVERLIRSYCRESGVRNLKKHVEKVYRKAAFQVVSREQENAAAAGGETKGEMGKVVVTEENLKEFVGSPVYTSDRMYETTPAGVVMGLAWTSMGGSCLYIESVVDSVITETSKPSFHRTGQMGDVMKESSTIAYTFAKSFLARKFPENKFFEHASVHMHVPEGATPKDGPSAGTTMTTYTPTNLPLSHLPVSVVNISNQPDTSYDPDSPTVKATISEILHVLKEISLMNPLLRDQILTFSIQTGGNAFQDAGKLADFAAAVSSGEPLELQAVLESADVTVRLQKALYVLKKELANAKLQKEISSEVDKKITRKQQEYFLMEQLKGIKKELGMESDGKDKLVIKFKERAEALTMPAEIRKVFDEEIAKLMNLEPQASEFNVTRNYLDWLTTIPWGKYSTENFDIANARVVLDEDHYGLKDVKDRILEFIAVGKLRGTVEGKIICMVGPPGVGKTSVGKSIARALGREFFRFSVGGLTDVAEIKGHRRTYVGAMPGKVIQALKKVQTENPLIMIDEIDKVGRGHQGDPSSALLELLDPEQNSSFLDHYMDVPLDLSKVLFVCTANSLDTIPGPLLDRMEVITVSGYVAEEKKAIAVRYLGPAALVASGLREEQVEVTEGAIERLIRSYCRESGVRNLKKHVEKVYRKAAFQVVSREQENAAAAGGETKGEMGKVVVTEENLKEFVGSPVYTSDRMYETTPAGVVMGLAWTSMGGSCLYIESVVDSVITETSKPSFHRTGQMGDVMKESSTIAYTFAKSFLARKFPENKFFEHASVHMHVPEGATPKDGPSAGTTMTTSLLSLALSTPPLANVAMTGELTLTGKVLKIGGLKEKAIAAKRSGVKDIIFPAANRSDWDELEGYVKEGLEPHFVAEYEDIFRVVFPGVKAGDEGGK